MPLNSLTPYILSLLVKYSITHLDIIYKVIVILTYSLTIFCLTQFSLT